MSADNYVYVGREGNRWFVEDRFASCGYDDTPDTATVFYDSYEHALEVAAERIQEGYYEYGLRTASPTPREPARALEAAKDRAYSDLLKTHKRTTAALERALKKGKFDRTRSYQTIGELRRLAQEVVTAYYVRSREEGLGMEEADMLLGNAIDRLYQVVGEAPQ